VSDHRRVIETLMGLDVSDLDYRQDKT